MIYKFNDNEQGTVLEIQHFDNENEPFDDSVNICISNEGSFYSVDINKKQLFKLIGALHCIQKEMK